MSHTHREPELLGQTVLVIGGSAGIGAITRFEGRPQGTSTWSRRKVSSCQKLVASMLAWPRRTGPETARRCARSIRRT
jgi:hypothetical protein